MSIAANRAFPRVGSRKVHDASNSGVTDENSRASTRRYSAPSANSRDVTAAPTRTPAASPTSRNVQRVALPSQPPATSTDHCERAASESAEPPQPATTTATNTAATNAAATPNLSSNVAPTAGFLKVARCPRR